jgi:ABC-type bacteriocin/lantibiotic exporter with double-glycine peptidase domain
MYRIDVAFCSLAACLVVAIFYDLTWHQAQDRREKQQLEELGSSFRRDFGSPCGVVVMTVVTKLLGRPMSLREARSKVPVDSAGRTSMAELALVAKSHGLWASGIQLGRLDNLPVGITMICRIRESHWVVVTRNTRGAFVVIDPPNKSIALTPKRLVDVWDGKALVVADSDQQLGRQLAILGIRESGL